MKKAESLVKWEKKNEKTKKYIHFDYRKSSKSKGIESYIVNPENIKKHSFYPFLHTEIIFKKFDTFKKNKKGKKWKEKPREINYSCHMDRLIFSYYSNLLNKKYNEYVQDKLINENVIAYRDNLNKNNIHFAKEAFDFIKQNKNCFIMIGNFTKFFDNLNHKYLKKMLCKVLNVSSLLGDWYTIFKNITKFSSCELEDIIKIKQMSKKELNSESRLFSPKEFRDLIKNNKLSLKVNRTGKGIPQGSAISAVLANVYMSEFDSEIVNYLHQYGGKYFRYSDDFIIIIPLNNKFDLKLIKKEINIIREKIPNLELSEEKTQYFIYENKKLKGSHCYINYLGFSFDGKNIFIRDKTIFKYYCRMYKKIRTINKYRRINKNNKGIGCKNLYNLYSIKGSLTKDKKRGNFINYIMRAEKIFGKKDSKKIKHIRTVHLKKIKKRLIPKISKN